MADLAWALRAAASAGSYFDLTLIDSAPADPAPADPIRADPIPADPIPADPIRADPIRAGAGWRSLPDLLPDPEVIGGPVESGRRVLAAMAGVPVEQIEVRAAASVVFLGLAARLLAPPIGAAVLAGTVPLLRLPALYWRVTDAGASTLGTLLVESIPVANLEADGDEATANLLMRTVHGPVAAVVEAFRAAFRLSEQVVWGNVGSAVGGAIQVLAAAAPTKAAAADAVGRALLRRQPLAGLTDPVPVGRPGVGWPPRRRTCCLFYRVPAAGLCADCVLDRAPRNRPV